MPAIIEFPTLVQHAVEQFGASLPMHPSADILPSI